MSEVIQNHTLTYKGRSFEINPIRRVLAPGPGIERQEVDDYGFRRPNFFISSGMQRYPGDLLRMSGRGGIIIGEGDVGKTWLVEQLSAENSPEMRVKTFRLRGFQADPRKLIDEAKEFWNSCNNSETTAHLVLDGLDENEQAWPVIAEICNHVHNAEKCKVWVTGRPRHCMDLLIRSGCLKDQYHLLPFSVDDVRDLAKMVEEDGDKFLKALANKQVASFATKPGGATLLLKMYGAGKFRTASRIKLTEDIAKSFAREGRDGCEIPANESKFRDIDLVDCAAWVATEMFFSRKDSLWMGNSLECPEGSVSFSDLPKGKYKDDILNAVIGRRLFEPLSEFRFRIAYDTSLTPFLVAYWMNRYMQSEVIIRTLHTDNGIGDVAAGVMKYLCLFNPELGRHWIELRPRSFLDCADTIKLYGAEKFYRLLEAQYLSLATFDYDSFIKGHADQLLGQVDLAEIATKRLKNENCNGRQAELAAMILRYTQLQTNESIDVLLSGLENNPKI